LFYIYTVDTLYDFTFVFVLETKIWC